MHRVALVIVIKVAAARRSVNNTGRTSGTKAAVTACCAAATATGRVVLRGSGQRYRSSRCSVPFSGCDVVTVVVR